jgi:2-amino-4-hydroxy-6-hydroxymethyldihydropteridine diphosphokinase
MNVSYFLALGSNIRPYENVPRMLDSLLTISPTLDVSPILITAPVGMPDSQGNFLNLVVRIQTRQTAEALKQFLSVAEISLGRDRSDPLRKIKNRVADMDILFALGREVTAVPAHLIPSGAYNRPQTLDLLAYLGLVWPANDQPETVCADLTTAELTYRGRPIGPDCVTIH